MIRVVLVDDQAVVRAGFRVILESEPDIVVVGEAAGGREAVDVVDGTRPDVVVMDVRMPAGNGIDATRAIVSRDAEGDASRAPAVLVVTTFDLDEHVFGALEAGASGFVLKDSDPEELIAAVRALAAGRGAIDSATTRRVIVEFARRRAATPPEPNDLTPRESDIVRLLGDGLSNEEIGARLFIETSTVKSHLTRVMGKLGTRDRLQTVVWAYRSGLLP
jgi:DNA-binding NarL/FixJ family response regulator